MVLQGSSGVWVTLSRKQGSWACRGLPPENENSLVLCMRFTRILRTASMQRVRHRCWKAETCRVHEEDPAGLSRAPVLALELSFPSWEDTFVSTRPVSSSVFPALWCLKGQAARVGWSVATQFTWNLRMWLGNPGKEGLQKCNKLQWAHPA